MAMEALQLCHKKNIVALTCRETGLGKNLIDEVSILPPPHHLFELVSFFKVKFLICCPRSVDNR